MEELRSDKEFAKEVLEDLLPDEKLRQRCLEFLASSIQTAYRLAAGRWGITLFDDGVRMNCGMIEVITILPDWVHVIVDGEILPDSLVTQAEVRSGTGKGFYPSVPGSTACDFAAEKVNLILPILQTAHEKLLQRASRTPFTPNRRKAHSPRVIELLSDELRLPLPQPSYYDAIQRDGQLPNEPSQNRSEVYPDVDLMDLSVWEGRKKFAVHLERERKPEIVAAKKQQVLVQTGRLSCEVCGFDFREVYGERGKDFCEAHHKKPLAEVDEETETRLDDLAILCSNCHGMIHKPPMLSVDELRELLLSNRHPSKR